MEAVFGGCCWICKKPEPIAGRKLSIDHCHDTGKVRGLLCTHCNTGLGHFNHDPDRIDKAIRYLERTS